ncbi:MAG: hypothetical protein F6J90_36335 [Moorea sp. SIOASIH]|uniref:hypothetical protein n=1 Tax=Moorena sp. SIOASIH TaxID=2607817 RepID=UPI0013BDBAC7|nr:hypothetical protein [Moorena sp. SIOASIH]NEO41506.1 hypothetical protein [Moorena sp. SIOASIH]
MVHRIFPHSTTPCSLFPVPYSLFPIPYSLFPIPYSLFPVPFSQHLLQNFSKYVII